MRAVFGQKMVPNPFVIMSRDNDRQGRKAFIDTSGLDAIALESMKGFSRALPIADGLAFPKALVGSKV